MLARKNRLNEEKDFKLIYKSGKFIFGQFVNLKFIKSNGENPQIAVIVSKKISKLATVRNKLKSQINEVILSVLDKMKKNIKLIINVKKNTENFQEIKKELLFDLKKGLLIHD